MMFGFGNGKPVPVSNFVMKDLVRFPARLVSCAIAVALAAAMFLAPEAVADAVSELLTSKKVQDEMMTLANSIIDCEIKAVNQYDNGQSIKDLARQIMGVCTVVRGKQHVFYYRLFKIPLNDPKTELDEFEQAVEIIEMVRGWRKGK
jgi:hypothetical protein